MPTASQQLKKRFNLINDAEEGLTRGIGGIQSDIFDEIIKILDKFSTKGGNLEYDRQAVKLINELEERINKAISKSDYPERVEAYLQSFDKIREVNIKLQSALNKLDASKVGLTNLQKTAQQLTTNNLLGAGLDHNFIQPVKDLIYQHAVGGASIADAELALREAIKGNPERLGLFERYVTQMARDSISQYDGTIQSRIMDEFDLDGYSYEGSIIRDSRPQCVRWVNEFDGVLRFEDLADEIEWAFNNGSGMIPGTTQDTFPINRGGYSCRHHATAIRID